MLVQVTYGDGGRKYTFDAKDLPVKVGDRVAVFSRRDGEAIVNVVELGSDYTGMCRDVLKIISRRYECIDCKQSIHVEPYTFELADPVLCQKCEHKEIAP